MIQFKGKEYPCTISLTMGLTGGKWKAVILYYLGEETLRYSELRKKIPHITERTLSLKLKTLEEDGILHRKAYCSKPPLKVEYSLTEMGITLLPLVRSIAEWGANLMEKQVEKV